MSQPVNPKELRATADGKVPLEYLEPALDAPLARVMKHGAEKYGYRNYTDSPCKVRTYIGAALRHLNAIRQGEDVDPDSGESHWAHIAACCAVVEGARSAGKLVDDRTAFSTPLSDRVHLDGDLNAKGLTAEYNRGIDELVEELAAEGCRQCDSAPGACATVGDPCPWQVDQELPVSTSENAPLAECARTRLCRITCNHGGDGLPGCQVRTAVNQRAVSGDEIEPV